MPHFLIPRKSGIHRAACFALFRALLRHKNRLAVGEQRTLLEFQLRDGFHKRTKEQSPPVIIAALRQGYELLKFLSEGAQRPPEVPSHITSFVSAPSIRKRIAQPTKLPPSGYKNNSTTGALRCGPRVWPYPGTVPIQNRPIPEVSGRRRVPHLINGNGLPFLRFKKPQPPYLGRLIRDNLHAAIKRSDRCDALRALIQFGNDEDVWDEALERTCGLAWSIRNCSWAWEARRGLEHVMKVQENMKKKRCNMGQQMQKIVEKEQVLVKMAELKRRDEKHRLRRSGQLDRNTSSSQEVEDPQKILDTLEVT